MPSPPSAQASIFTKTSRRASDAFPNAAASTAKGTPSPYTSICAAVAPRRVPATLQSMLPKWSSVPVGSTSKASPASPTDAAPTSAFKGTPQSCSANEAAQTAAMEVLPDDAVTLVRTVVA